MRLVACLLLALPGVLTVWNIESQSVCDPARYSTEGSGYCTNQVDGWNRGGTSTGVDLERGGGTCQRADRGSCRCEDCAAGSTKCLDYRCPDATGETRYNAVSKITECFLVGTNTLLNEEEYDYCFLSRSVCDKSICKKGQYMAGCLRTLPGRCEACPALAAGKYWSGVGHGLQSCTDMQISCTVPKPGFFIKTACTSEADAVVKSCAEYPGNKQSMKDMSPEQQRQVIAGAKGVFDIDRFYCPAGNLVLRLPPNALASSDYTSFLCKPGFYLQDETCLPCSPGSACVHGGSFSCPANYYSKSMASSSCLLCTVSCSGKRRPLRCGPGSTYDGGCVSCGACGYSADTGLACVDNNYEMQSLKKECSPTQAGVWQCKNQ